MKTPKLVAFDIDGTLTESKLPVTAEMATLLGSLLDICTVAFMTGGTLAQVDTQLLSHLPESAKKNRLYILPTSGSALYEYKHDIWTAVYKNRLTEEEVEHITSTLQETAKETGIIDFRTPSYGERIENRGSQVSLSALGQQAPLSEKQLWDPTREKRLLLQAKLIPLLQGYDVTLGGLTTFDITKQGINKAYGVRRVSEYLSIPIREMLYIGDALFEGGNDAVVKETGITTKQVTGPNDTQDVIREIIKSVE